MMALISLVNRGSFSLVPSQGYGGGDSDDRRLVIGAPLLFFTS